MRILSVNHWFGLRVQKYCLTKKKNTGMENFKDVREIQQFIESAWEEFFSGDFDGAYDYLMSLFDANENIRKEISRYSSYRANKDILEKFMECKKSEMRLRVAEKFTVRITVRELIEQLQKLEQDRAIWWQDLETSCCYCPDIHVLTEEDYFEGDFAKVGDYCM